MSGEFEIDGDVVDLEELVELFERLGNDDTFRQDFERDPSAAVAGSSALSAALAKLRDASGSTQLHSKEHFRQELQQFLNLQHSQRAQFFSQKGVDPSGSPTPCPRRVPDPP